MEKKIKKECLYGCNWITLLLVAAEINTTTVVSQLDFS